MESWVEWIQRTAHVAEKALHKAGIDDWVKAQRRNKFRWAGHAARRTDQRWSHQVLDCFPEEGKRSVGRPKLKWSDSLDNYFCKLGTESGDDGWQVFEGMQPGAWLAIALDREEWHEHDTAFVAT